MVDTFCPLECGCVLLALQTACNRHTLSLSRVCVGELLLVVFLGALDTTIVATLVSPIGTIPCVRCPPQSG